MGRNNQSLTIRAATEQDAPALARLIGELAEATGLGHKFRAVPNDYIEYGFGEKSLFKALVASVDGEAVGAALYLPTFSSWYGEPGVYLQDLVVTASSRGDGIGRALLCRVAREASAQGATYLRLAVDRANDGAMGFYRNAGLRMIDEDRIFGADGEAFEALAACAE